MSVIKCPECGHQASDKAPTCPNCGIEISGKVKQCPSCGEYYFITEPCCPKCHHGAQPVASTVTQQAAGHAQPGITAGPQSSTGGNGTSGNGRKSRKTLYISFVIALAICGAGFYMYNNSLKERELEEYNYAMKSSDPLVLQSYLDNFSNAPQEHIDSVKAHLDMLGRQDQQWTNAMASGSKSALLQYIEDNPNSMHKQQALDLIDSIDWKASEATNTEEAYQEYLNTHESGKYYDEAMEAIKKLKANSVTDEETIMVENTFHGFFSGINSKNANQLLLATDEHLTLLDKSNATKDDLTMLMNKLNKDENKSTVWTLGQKYNIKKREIGIDKYEYTVDFKATQQIEGQDGKTTINKYTIKATLTPEGYISKFSLFRAE